MLRLLSVGFVLHGVNAYAQTASHDQMVAQNKMSATQSKNSTYVLSSKVARDLTAQLWNLYSEKVICGSATGKYPDQHIFKRSIAMRVHVTVLTDYFLDDENVFPIDVNAIQIHPNGQRKTLLDFVNHIVDTPRSLAKYDDIQIKLLQETIVEYYGAKTAVEIDLER